MGRYYDNRGKLKGIELLGYKWKAIPEEEFNKENDDTTYRENISSNLLAIEPMRGDISGDISNFDPAYPECDRRIEVEILKDDNGEYIAGDIYYPIFDEDDLYATDSTIILNKKEKAFFTGLIRGALKNFDGLSDYEVEEVKAMANVARWMAGFMTKNAAESKSRS